MSKKPEILSLRGVGKRFYQGDKKLEVLHDVFFNIYEGEIVGLVGPSGCGKSTLLHIAGLLDMPDRGGVWIKDKECTKISDNNKTLYRRNEIGFVYQAHHLLPDFNALENVMIPQMSSGTSVAESRENSIDVLKYLGLADRVSHKPGELSGGEQQRVAIARALANKPSILLADEPTGNLDPKTADEVFDLFIKSVKSVNLCALIVTHNPDLAKKMDRVLTIENGTIVEVTKTRRKKKL